MIRGQITTEWVFDGANVPKCLQDYEITEYRDVTGQPDDAMIPNPPTFVAEIVASSATWALIEAQALLPNADFVVLFTEEA